jgi:hypothetical protein
MKVDAVVDSTRVVCKGIVESTRRVGDFGRDGRWGRGAAGAHDHMVQVGVRA